MTFTQLRDPQTIAKSLFRYDQIHAALPDPTALTDAHVKQFHEQGFIAIERVFSRDEVCAAQDALSDLIAGRNPKFNHVQLEDVPADLVNVPPAEREKYVRKLFSFTEADARLCALRDHPVLMSIVERLMGESTTMVQDMALLKPAHIGREKPWHQDNAYFLYEPLDKVIGTWTALDPATLENGCMHLIPGSHRQGAQPHFHDRDCQIPDQRVPVSQDVVVPLQPGGVLFFYGMTLHATPPNHSGDRRRAIQLHYAGKSCRKMKEQEHADLFHEGKVYAGCVRANELAPTKMPLIPF